METPLTVAILAGGLTHEREVSLHSGRRVAKVLREAGMQVRVLDVDATLLQSLSAIDPDVVWPLIHGSTGEDGSLQDLLHLMGLPHVGSLANECRIASDKGVANSIIAKAGVSTPRSISIPQKLFREVGVTQMLDLVKARFGFPLVVKPSVGGSSLGVTIVKEAAELPRAMVDCYAYGDTARIEEFIEGREIAVSIIEDGSSPDPLVLPAVEIVTEGSYDYDARYFAGRAEYFVPARLDEDETARVCEAALAAYTALHLRHLARVDLILSQDGVPYVLDVNVAPGMTETSLLPQAVAAYAKSTGSTVDEVYVGILRAALGSE